MPEVCELRPVSELRFISGEAALRNFIEQVREDVDRQLDERKVNASGALKRSNRTEVVMGMGSSSATLYALDYWHTAGSGSPPGTRTSAMALVQWAKDKGLASNDRHAARIALLVQRKILREGSRQWREGGENIYTTAIERAQPGVGAVLSAFLSDIPKALVSQFGRAFKAA